MARIACVNARALPLQLLLRRHPEWKGRPVVVVDRDKPQGVIQWASEAALKSRIYPGMRYAAALSLSRECCGGIVADDDIQAAVQQVTEHLWGFSPRIEAAKDEPGVFWLDASGLQFVFPSLEKWSAEIQNSLAALQFRSVVAVAFSRFGSYATARSSRRNVIFKSTAEEQSHVRRVPLHRLNFEPRLLDTLTKLGIETLGGFIELPPGGVAKRFGAEAEKIYRLALGKDWQALDPENLSEPVAASMGLDYPENDTERLLAVVSVLLQSLLEEFTRRHEELASLHIHLTLDNNQEHAEEIATANPTLDSKVILTLCRLRLESLSLNSSVVEVKMSATGVEQTECQEFLFAEMSGRRYEAAEQAVAKIRAEFGSDSVVYAQVHEGHLPEARYSWVPLQHFSTPTPSLLLVGPLVRQIYTPSLPLPSCERRDPDGWLISGLADGPVEEVIGPYHINGGWWLRELQRDYYDVRTRSGRWLWIYYDRVRRQWYLQGEVQ